MLCKNCGREMPMIGKNCPFCGASTLLSRPSKQTTQNTTNANANDETTFFVPLSEDGHVDLSAFREALQGRRPATNQNETAPEISREREAVEPSQAAQRLYTDPAQQPVGQQTAPLPHTATTQQLTGQQQTAPRSRTAPTQQQPIGQQQTAPRSRTAPTQQQPMGQQQTAPRSRTAPTQQQPMGQQQTAPRPRTASAQQQPAGRQQAAPRPRTASAQQQPAGRQQAAPRPRTAPPQQQPVGRQAAQRPQTTPAPAYNAPTEDTPYETPYRRTHSRKKTTYYDPETNDIRPYRKRSLGQRILTKLCVMAAIAGIAGGAIYYYNTLNEKTDENLVAAQKYMEHGQFDNALNAFQQALSEAKDSATIQLQIDHLKSYKQASDFLEDKDYSSAITTLNDLKGRLTDSTSPLAEAVDELLTTVQSERAKSIKTPDTSNKPNSTDDKPDDTSTNDPDDTDSDNDNDDTSSNANHTTDPTPNDNDSKPDEDQQATSQQEERAEEKRQQQQAFSRRIGSLESDDNQISSAEDSQEKLEMTSRSFEAWDTMLADLYDSLASVTSADDYANEEQSYQEWIAERDQGAANAASENPDSEEGQLAAAQFKQSYTKTQCYKILDKLGE